MKKWMYFSEDQIREMCEQSTTYAEFCKKLGYQKPGSISVVKDLIGIYNLDCSHFVGQGWKKNQFCWDNFQKGKNVTSETRLAALIFLRGNKCEKCGRDTWDGQSIPLCTHHIDGDHLNNELSNLQLLCCNCHALTDNYCGKNKGGKRIYTDQQYIDALNTSYSIWEVLQKIGIHYSAKYHYDKAKEFLTDGKASLLVKNTGQAKEKSVKKQDHFCVNCGILIKDSRSKYCVNCGHTVQRKVIRPSKDELWNLISNNSFVSIGKKYGVSDNTVRKWCKAYGLPYKKSDLSYAPVVERPTQ